MDGDGLTIKMYQRKKKRSDMKLAVKSIKKIFGNQPAGWYTGRCSDKYFRFSN